MSLEAKFAFEPAKRTFVCDHEHGPFFTVETADGSLTACFGEHETMHSLRGAFSETVYIYGTALDRAREALASAHSGDLKPASSAGVSVTPDFPRTLSLGLGVGYVEILAAAYALKRGQTPRGESFELVDDLTKSFEAWLAQDATSDSKSAPRTDSASSQRAGRTTPLVPFSLYDDIARRTSELVSKDGREISAEDIRQALANAVTEGQWLLRPAMELRTEFTEKFQGVAFDAFSSKSTPELWSREFLDHFLKTACDTPCVLSTYACTGHLKRALVEAGFNLEIREGYASKRDSTLATRS